MKAIFTFASLLVVLAVVAVSVRNELRSEKVLLPATASAASSSGPSDPAAPDAAAPFGGASSPSVAQFQRELDKTMRSAADGAASAASAADAP